MPHSAEREDAAGFDELLRAWRETGSCGTDDVLGAALPLIEQVASLHEAGQIAPLEGAGALRVSMGQLWFPNSLATAPKINNAALRDIEQGDASGLDITGRYKERSEAAGVSVIDASIGNRAETTPRRAYFPDYVAWEQRAGHHDQLSDVFVLGSILGSLALRLDLSDTRDLRSFVHARWNVMQHNPRIHPVVSQIIEKMTDLDRRRRPQDLRQIANALARYRDQDVDHTDTEPERRPSHTDRAARRLYMYEQLRDRLFEISRRNRLIYFRDTSGTINLTAGSMPALIDHKAIRPAQLFFLNDKVVSELRRPVALSTWLQFTDYSYLPTVLDRIRLDGQRDAREYGFSQLRLVVAFLRWTNLKDAPGERITSPLILLPAELTKKKGVKDSFHLETDLAEAQINPALRFHLRQLYDIRLPETIDLTNMEVVRALHQDLERQIARLGKGVELKLVETPRIQLIQRSARRKLDDYRRRGVRTGAAIKDHGGLAYSYARATYEPLGVQIFERDIRVARAPRRELVENTVKPRMLTMVAEPDGDTTDAEPEERQRDFYAIDDGQDAGSHDWEIDLCSVTLANFNYRKMTLVRDYNDLITGKAREHVNFNLLFSEEARRAFRETDGEKRDDYIVLPSDPSQTEAVARASGGESYVIQGPPGTGKSQTITNLIADYVARGKGVLFVCEKRAALDVVYHRLKQTGLGDVVTLIHDSQGDKKSFIEELKVIYETWTSKKPRIDVVKQRIALVGEIDARLAELERFSAAMTAPIEAGGPPLRDLIEERLKHGEIAADLPPAFKGTLPGRMAFQAALPFLHQLRDALISSGYDGILARSPLRLLRGDLAGSADATVRVERALPRARTALGDAAEALGQMQALLGRETVRWDAALTASAFAQGIQPLAEAGRLDLLDADGAAARRLAGLLVRLARLAAKVDEARAVAGGWSSQAEATPDLAAIIAGAQKYEGKFLTFIYGEWRRAKSLVRTHYRGRETSVTKALNLLAQVQSAIANRDVVQKELAAEIGFEITPDLRAVLDRIWGGGSALADIERDVVNRCLDGPAVAAEAIHKIARRAPALSRAEEALAVIFSGHAGLTHAEIATGLDALAGNTGQIAEFADLLAALDQAGAEVSQTLRLVDLPLEHIEVAVLDAVLDRVFRRNRALDRFDSARLESIARELTARYADLRGINARFAVNACHQEFHDDLARSNHAGAASTRQEKEWQNNFRRGRKTLENEFGKSRAYKSIRELFAGEAGPAMRRLKPVWLMSPLSVADILPLEEQLFDVVIFDEASQIPLEDAIPTLYRARQMIVVGDEMQLPPSAYFASAGGGEEEDANTAAGLFVHDLNADSFLNRASAALPRTMLAWHYRSQHEALIGFCNKAFYKGQLQTVPSVAELARREPIRVTKADDAKVFAERALSQPLSYHRMDASPYDSQRNPGEAAYIAQLVREILNRKPGLSIGIVAFSQAQRVEIDRALDALAAGDRDFRNKLDLEEEREHEGQYVGLFVKNLENVQGDERDVIIVSVCYGPDAKGRMIMNFGPINQNGGEKRLNVIFSRAKRHMMIVSSIDAAQITNTYNYGANALRKYLAYAQAASLGEQGAMSAALIEYGARDPSFTEVGQGQRVADQIAAKLREAGLIAIRNHGQSDLKCHIAVKRDAEGDFKIAIQIDDRAHYDEPELATRYVVGPSILGSFGWDVITVLGKDWRTDPTKVIERITSRL